FAQGLAHFQLGQLTQEAHPVLDARPRGLPHQVSAVRPVPDEMALEGDASLGEALAGLDQVALTLHLVERSDSEDPGSSPAPLAGRAVRLKGLRVHAAMDDRHLALRRRAALIQ